MGDNIELILHNLRSYGTYNFAIYYNLKKQKFQIESGKPKRRYKNKVFIYYKKDRNRQDITTEEFFIIADEKMNNYSIHEYGQELTYNR